MHTANLPFHIMENFKSLIRDVNPDRDYFISVHTDELDKARTPIPANTLYVAFDDNPDPADPDSVDTAIAQAIARFILDVRAQRGNLWVNCWAGISRSGAIVETLIRLGWKDIQHPEQETRVPNPLVEGLLLKQFTELRGCSPKFKNGREWSDRVYAILYQKKTRDFLTTPGAPKLVTSE